MHHFVHDSVGFMYNSDLSGDVEICVDDVAFPVPGAALLAFVAEYVRRERIAEIENAEPFNLLGLARAP